ncbi:MAG: HD domain-containing protein [Burkholderiales bacterium]|nr:HD domain-containing protein [Burkholderiales bacterium]
MDSAPVPFGDDSAQAAHALRVVMFAMATLAELRESDTESHLQRVQRYVRVLADKLRGNPMFAPTLTQDYIDLLCASVPMYDMGTIGIPDRILLKPGRLSPEEVTIMRTHTTLGYEAIVRAEKTLGKTSPLLHLAKEIALSHQEKWDGKGYPRGLSGTQIPLSARILAVADVYDALISNKVYKQGVTHEEAVQVIFGERASHFDPDVVDAFIEVSPEFAVIAQRFADTDDDMQKKIEYLANAIAENAEL